MGGTVSCFEIGASGALLHAAVDGNAGAAKAALQQNHLLVLHKGVGGLHDTAWHLAAAYGHVEVLEALYNDLLANKKAVTRKLQAKKKHKDITEDQAVLLTVNKINVKGQTALMFACFAGRVDCVKALMKMGSDAWISDRCGGRTAMHYAAMHGHAECVRAVMEPLVQSHRHVHVIHGNEVNLLDIKTVSGFTPLHYAAYARKPGIISTLLEFDANLAALTTLEGSYDITSCPQGTTPLHIAALQGNEIAARELLEFYLACRDAGLMNDPRVCHDRAGRLPFHVARLRGHTSLSEMIHPLANLDALFDQEHITKLGVPRLAILSARVLRKILLAELDVADSKLALLPPLSEAGSDPEEGGLPRASSVRISRQPSLKQGRHSKQAPRTPRASRSNGGIDLAGKGETPGSQGTGPQVARSEKGDVSDTEGVSDRVSKRSSFRSPFQRMGTSGLRPSAGVVGGSDDGRSSVGASTKSAKVPKLTPGAMWALGTNNSNNPEDPKLPKLRPSKSAREVIKAPTQDWWAPDVDAEPTTPGGASPGTPHSLVGMPTPNDQSVLVRSPSVLRRLKSLKRRNSKAGPSLLDTAQGLAPAAPASEAPSTPGPRGASPASTFVPMSRAPSNRSEVSATGFLDIGQPGLGMGQGLTSAGYSGGVPIGLEDMTSMAALAWGTQAMVQSLPRQTQCTICLDDVYTLVLAPCLHRLCAPCARHMVNAVQDKPLDCPVCRQHVRGCFAPNDTMGLVGALDMHM